MELLNNRYYIVRNGDFATDGNTKILYCVFSILLSIEDYINNNSINCFSIMIGSTFIWTVIEYMLYITNTRIIKPMYIYLWNRKIELHKYVGLFLQGFQEGGFITTIGLYFGDRLNNINYVLIYHLLITFMIINIITKYNIIKSSKRQINTHESLIFIVLITLYNLKMIYQYSEHNMRQLKMFIVMIYLSSIWTFFTWYKGFRTAEVYLINENNKYIKKSPNNFEIFLILLYDIIFEIGIAYLTFYNLFIL
jgi:hypothetical protein